VTLRGQKAEETLARYVARMAGRATPFGLFSGCAAGSIGRATSLRIGPSASASRHSRLDGDLLFALAEALAKDPAVRRALTYRVNTSLYEAAGRLRYAAQRIEGKTRSYALTTVEPTPYLRAVLERAAGGARRDELSGLLPAMDPDVEPADAEAFVDELIDSQILVADLDPPVTGREPTLAMVDALSAIAPARAVAGALDRARRALVAIDEGGLGRAPEAYQRLAADLAALPVEVELSRLVQVDLVKRAPEATLGGAPLAEILRGVDLLDRLTPYADPLAELTRAFAERYGGEEVPLLTALDEEAGLGFDPVTGPAGSAEPLLAGLAFPADPAAEAWGPRERHLLGLIEEAVRTGARAVALGEADLEALAVRDRPPLPDAVAITASIAAASQEALDRGDFRVLLGGVAGPSGANLLGRFCHGDPDLAAKVAAHLRAEEALRPDAVFAEIVHLPEGRLGNILLRPVLRGHEIPYLGRSGAPEDRQIHLSDLVLCLVDDQVRLRSRRLAKEVLPRLTSAHNWKAGRNLPVYRFLCALARRGRAEGAGFSWGPLAGAGFLPRITVGRLVLSRARWTLRGARLPKRWGEGAEEQLRVLSALRAEIGLPRFVALSEGDRELPLDLESPLAAGALADAAKNGAEVALVEVFPGPDELCCTGPEGRFVHELVVPLVRRQPSGARAERAIPRADASPSIFAPGSEWLYAKLYTGTATADRVLSDLVAPVAARALGRGAADRWFFLRYADPGWHLRLRLHGAPDRLWSEVSRDLFDSVRPLLDDGRVAEMVLSTYKREADRYGGPAGIDVSERIFQADSEAVAAWAGDHAGDGPARWQLALLGVDAMLDDIGLGLEDKRAVIERARLGFGARFRPDAALRRSIGDRFRKERIALGDLLDGGPGSAAIAAGRDALRRRSDATKPLFAALHAREERGELSRPLSDMAGSFVHMYVNRLLRADAVAQEVVVYDFLGRIYDSWIARGTRGPRAS
jgi:thiopeptide-type bacteriocin biosynthesis protein